MVNNFVEKYTREVSMYMYIICRLSMIKWLFYEPEAGIAVFFRNDTFSTATFSVPLASVFSW